MSVSIIGVGCGVPEHAIAQDDAACQAAAVSDGVRPAVVSMLYRHAGVRTRHSVVLRSSTNGAPAKQNFYCTTDSGSPRGPTTGERMRRYAAEAADLAALAAQRALGDAAVPPDSIRQLVTVSCSGFDAPGVDVSLIECLGLNAEIGRTHVGFMGCHGALNGLRVAKALALAEPGAAVLLCSVELCSLHHQYGANAQQMVANALFADGAAALVLAASADASCWNVVSQQGTVVAGTRDAMSWRIGDHGFEMALSPRVPDIIRAQLRPWLAAWLEKCGLRIDEIGSWAVHPGGPRILAAAAESLGLADEALKPSRQILAEFGNMSSPTLLFVIDHLRTIGAALPCVALAFGPGLTIEAALFDQRAGKSDSPG